jgi:hypothetical protein
MALDFRGLCATFLEKRIGMPAKGTQFGVFGPLRFLLM